MHVDLGVGVKVQARRWIYRINKLHMFHNYVVNQSSANCGWVDNRITKLTIRELYKRKNRVLD